MEALGIDPKTGSEKAATNRLNMYRKQLVTHLIQAGPEKKVANRIAKASFLAAYELSEKRGSLAPKTDEQINFMMPSRQLTARSLQRQKTGQFQPEQPKIFFTAFLQLTSMANFDCLIEFPLQTWFLLFAMWYAAGRVSDPQRTAHASPHTPLIAPRLPHHRTLKAIAQSFVCIDIDLIHIITDNVFIFTTIYVAARLALWARRVKKGDSTVWPKEIMDRIFFPVVGPGVLGWYPWTPKPNEHQALYCIQAVMLLQLLYIGFSITDPSRGASGVYMGSINNKQATDFMHHVAQLPWMADVDGEALCAAAARAPVAALLRVLPAQPRRPPAPLSLYRRAPMSARRETMHTVIEVEGIIVIVFLVIWAFALLPLLCEAFALPPFVGPEEAEMLVQIMEQFPHGCDKKTARTFLHLDADGNAKPKKELVVSKVVTKMFYGHKGAMRQTTVEDSLQGVVGAPAQEEPRLTHEEAMAEARAAAAAEEAKKEGGGNGDVGTSHV